MFERYTDSARRVVVLAQENARLLHHDYVGIEHFLIALTRTDDAGEPTIASAALAHFNLSEQVIIDAVVEHAGRGAQFPSGHINLTPRCKKMLEFALREALQLGHNYISAQHLLLGILREGESLAVKVLIAAGVEPVVLRQKTLVLMADAPANEGRGADARSTIVLAQIATARRAMAVLHAELVDLHTEMINRCIATSELPTLVAAAVAMDAFDSAVNDTSSAIDFAEIAEDRIRAALRAAALTA